MGVCSTWFAAVLQLSSHGCRLKERECTLLGLDGAGSRQLAFQFLEGHSGSLLSQLEVLVRVHILLMISR